jgi:hypothetical protein
LIDGEVRERVFITDTRRATKQRYARKAEQLFAKVQHGE